MVILDGQNEIELFIYLRMILVVECGKNWAQFEKDELLLILWSRTYSILSVFVPLDHAQLRQPSSGNDAIDLDVHQRPLY